MINVLKTIKELKDKTRADFCVVGNQDDNGNYILALQKGTFEQHHIMPEDTGNTVESIAASFNMSFEESQQDAK
ncbi:MAG: hypothetical protein ACI9EP_001750 [Oceanospirillaceae bacterium]|jgi:hypothetical protein